MNFQNYKRSDTGRNGGRFSRRLPPNNTVYPYGGMQNVPPVRHKTAEVPYNQMASFNEAMENSGMGNEAMQNSGMGTPSTSQIVPAAQGTGQKQSLSCMKICVLVTVCVVVLLTSIVATIVLGGTYVVNQRKSK